MPIRVFPVDPSGSPHYGDDFGYVKPGGTHPHQGIDIFGAKGTPVHAVDDGQLRFDEDPLGGHVFYLTGGDGVVYYGAHLSAYEGPSPRTVTAGDVVGYVGDTGNARGTSPHLHFEKHPGGGPAVDPFPELKQIAPQFATGGATPAPVSPAKQLAPSAKALVAAYMSKHPEASYPPLDKLALPFAWAMGEGTFKPPYQGTNNWGSYHATAGFAKRHANDAGYGMLAFLDHNPKPYITRMGIWPSPLLGARAYLDLVELDVGDLTAVVDELDYVTRIYVHGYFEGFHEPRTPVSQRAAAAAAGTLTPADQENIADGVTLVDSFLNDAQGAMAAQLQDGSDPSAVPSSRTFATLAVRLTPASKLVDYTGALVDGAPHTIAHARQILGPAADTPPVPGAITIADAQAAPGGDGVWIFASSVPQAPAPQPSASTRSSTAAGAIAAVAGVVLGALGAVATAARKAPARRVYA
jgi:hypothetical protein